MDSYSDFLQADRDIIKQEVVNQQATMPSTNGHSKQDTFDNTLVYVPELPESARVDTSQNEYACGWLDSFSMFSKKMSPRAYDGFHEAVGLWLLSTIAARRVRLTLGIKRFYPSLYIALTAPTTVFSKSTTVNTGYRVLQASGLDFLLTPDDSTPQAFINDMAGHVDNMYGAMTDEQKTAEKMRISFSSKCGWFYEEFGMKLEAMMRAGGFMADFRGMLRVLDDGKDKYVYKTMTRRDEVINPYLSLLANLTPADLRPHARAGGSLWGDGFLARFAFVSPPPRTRPNKGRFPEKETSLPANLITPLKEWHYRLGIATADIEEVLADGKATGDWSVTVNETEVNEMGIGIDVLDSFYSYHDALMDMAADAAEEGDDDLNGSYGRFGEKAMRVAILLASVNGDETIESIHWARAQTITESWRRSLHNLKDHLTEQAPSQERKEHEKIIKMILKFEHGATASQLAKTTRAYSTAEIDNHCKRMMIAGSLIVASTTRQNTNIYKVAA